VEWSLLNVILVEGSSLRLRIHLLDGVREVITNQDLVVVSHWSVLIYDRGPFGSMADYFAILLS
jgi:hypothetical protein